MHTLCRKEYIHVWYISNEANKEHVPTPSRTRSSTPTFEFKTKCFLCGCGVTAREKNFKQSSEVLSKNIEIDDSIKEASRNRSYDDWSLTVLGHLEGISDLHAADAIYHHACYSNFKTNKNLPQKYQQVLEAGSKRGRPKNVVLENIYEEICNYMKGLEENDELITVPLLNAKMGELCVEKGRNPYDKKYLKKRITEDFDGSIVIANINGNADS